MRGQSREPCWGQACLETSFRGTTCGQAKCSRFLFSHPVPAQPSPGAAVCLAVPGAIRRGRKEDSTRRVHRERRSHVQKRAERVKGIADMKKPLQLQLLCCRCCLSPRAALGLQPRGRALGFVCAESLPCLGRAGQGWGQRDLCPLGLCGGPGAALGSEPAGAIPAALAALREP